MDTFTSLRPGIPIRNFFALPLSPYYHIPRAGDSEPVKAGDRGTEEIYTMNPDGSNPTRLTYSGGVDPAWSPDGSKSAFECQGEICAMNADGSNQTNITNTPNTDEFAPDWQPLPAGLKPPNSKDQCKKGGYKELGFKNQG